MIPVVDPYWRAKRKRVPSAAIVPDEPKSNVVNDAVIALRLPKHLRDAFAQACENRAKSMTKILRALIVLYITEDTQRKARRK